MRGIQERDGSNTPTVSYTRGSDLSGSMEGAGGIGGLLGRSTGNGSTWTSHAYYHADGNGNVTYLETSGQGLAASYRYDAYGNTVSQSGSLASINVYRFSSKAICEDTFWGLPPLYYYGYRWYAPNLQRWLNRDPLAMQMPQDNRLWGNKLHIEVEQGANLYWPFANQPISNHDPDGRIIPLIPPLIIIGGGILFGGCSKTPPPPPNDPDDCWKNSNKNKTPSPGAGKQLACLARKTGCLECCEDKHPIKGGDPKKYEECVAGCEDNYKRCAALDTTTQR